MVDKLLVGIDFSPASRRALDRGVEWAGRLGVPLVVLHVLPLPAPMPFGAGMDVPPTLPETGWFDRMEADTAKTLQDWVKGIPDVQTRIVWGTPSVKLLENSDANTLLLVAQKSHSKFEHLFFGSTAAHVAREAPCDVLVVR